MLEIEIDGRALEVADGSTIMEAAAQIGTIIPHFCYHKKLSIAANCRMCLVQVEKAPKPLPACATPVTHGMKIWTHSELAVQAQKGVMEFLLINHPLDCPICDQGGECTLQDLAVGYGASASRYQEEKRVVVDKYLGSLIATDMTRCIHCTRCVRFTQEIAGVMELGQAFRGEHSEIMPFVEKTVNSEISGNVIDLCPVGALTSKPFRFAARTWELSRRKSISPHDGLGSNLIVQVKDSRVYRVLPHENEAINECWLSDKDRFSYEALNSAERILHPMIKEGNNWKNVDWHTALNLVSSQLKQLIGEHGAHSIGALASPHATVEELYLLQKFMRGLGSDNLDFRLRHSRAALDARSENVASIPWLGMEIASIAQLDRVLIIGSFLNKDHPLIAQRLRQSAKQGAQISLVHATNDKLYINFHAQAIVKPSLFVQTLAEIIQAVSEYKGLALSDELASYTAGLTISAEAKKIAESLSTAQNGAIFLGNLVQQSPDAPILQALSEELAKLTSLRVGFLGEAANTVGGYIAGALPSHDGLNAYSLFANPLKAYLLLNTEPELDCHNPQQAITALNAAKFVVSLSSFKDSKALEYAHVILPISPFTETSGTFINTEGRVQTFNAVVKPAGETRPAWKIFRVLGNLFNLSGFEQDSSEDVRNEVLGKDVPEFVKLPLAASPLPSAPRGVAEQKQGTLEQGTLERITDVPIYFTDSLVRRAPSLQKTKDAQVPHARMNAQTLSQLSLLGISEGDEIRIHQGSGEALLKAILDAGVPDGCIRIAAGHPLTADLTDMHGNISVERV